MFSQDIDTLFDDIEDLIMHGKSDELKSILNENKSLLNLEDTTKQTLLHISAKHNNLKMTEYLISLNLDINAKDAFGWTPLMIATSHADQRITKLLLNANSSIFTTNIYGQNALQMFLDQKNVSQLDILNLFFDKIKSRFNNAEKVVKLLIRSASRLDMLIHYKDAKVVELFLLQQSNIDSKVAIRSISNCMVFLYKENLKALLQHGVGVQQRRIMFLKFVHRTAANNGEQTSKMTQMAIELLIELKFLNENTSHFVDVLFMTANEEPLRVLLQSDLSSYIESEFGYNPTAYVFGNTRQSVFNLIKSDVRYTKALGRSRSTGLHIAVYKSALKNVQYLLQMGADPNALTESGKSPIFFTYQYVTRKKECVKLLLEYGADIQIRTHQGKYIFDCVGIFNRCKDTFMVLLNHLALQKIQGVPIKKELLDYLSSRHLIKYYNKSLKQLENMKSHIVCGTLTLQKALTSNVNGISRRVWSLNDESFRKLFRSQEMQSYDRYYIEILFQRILKAFQICTLRRRAEDFLSDTIEELSHYYVVIEKICDYLTYDDLLIFS